jgi:hypothetical protein
LQQQQQPLVLQQLPVASSTMIRIQSSVQSHQQQLALWMLILALQTQQQQQQQGTCNGVNMQPHPQHLQKQQHSAPLSATACCMTPQDMLHQLQLQLMRMQQQ